MSTLKLTTDKDEIRAQLEELLALAEAGQKFCVALRVFNNDGMFKDVVMGGDSDDERAEVLADLRAKFSQLN